MPARIEKLTIQSFKGASCPVEINFNTQKPAVLIFGENGTGKSTIIDALDFICNENSGSINDRSMPGNECQYLPTIGSTIEDVNLNLTYNGHIYNGKIGSGNKPYTFPKDGLPNFWVLRRSKILEMVIGQPKKRYEAMKMFIEVPKCEKAENTLRTAIKDKKADYELASKMVLESKEQINNLWELEGKPGEDAVSWARKIANTDKSELNATVVKLDEFLSGCGSAKQLRDDLKAIQESKKMAQSKLDLAISELEKQKEKAVNKADELVNTLESAQRYIVENETIESCPVCLKKIDDIELIKQDVKKRISELKELKMAMKRVTQAKVELDRMNDLYLDKCKNYLRTIRSLAITINGSSLPVINSLIGTWDSYKFLLDTTQELNLENMVEALNFHDDIAKQFERLSKEFEEKKKQLNLINACKTNIEAIDKHSKDAQQLEELIKRLNKIHPIFENERKKHAEKVLENIAGSIDIMYSQVHPDEGLGGIRFSMKKKGQGSVEYTGTFQGQEVSPQAYFSESHLDTLGVCIFLALAKHYKDEDTIVALDDVITSVDQAHMTRLMNMLHTEAGEFNQLFITTHYRPWRNKYKYAKGPAGNVQLIELLHWSMPRGVRPTKTKLCIEEIQEALATDNFDRQLIASKVGVFLEAILDGLTYQYPRCKLSRKSEPGYQLGELFDSIPGKLRKRLKIEKHFTDKEPVEIILEPLITQLNQDSWIRNRVGCHYNIIGDDIADSEVRQFGENTVTLANALICDDCGEIPAKRKSGSYFECSCSKTRLHPLETP
ncbi:AAA family ATPase [bacterium]|nr:AAA family ATPase [bacterium]